MANVAHAHTYKSQPLTIFIIFQLQIVTDGKKDPCNSQCNVVDMCKKCLVQSPYLLSALRQDLFKTFLLEKFEKLIRCKF